MSDIALDLIPSSPTFNDLLVEDGDLVITPTQLDAIEQHIVQRLRVFLGEWFLNINLGLPYFQQILTKNPDQSKIDGIFANEIMGTPGVVALTSYSFVPNFVTRQLTITFSAQTTSGTVNYAGLISV